MNRTASRLQSRLLSGGALTMLARVYMMGLSLLLNMVVAKSMSPADCGTFLLGTNIIVFVCLFAMGGLEQVTVKLIAGDAGMKSRSATRRLVLQLSVVFGVSLLAAGTVSIFAMLGPVGRWLSFPEDLTLLVVLCAALLAALKMLSVFLRSFHSIAASSLFDGRTGGVVNSTLLLLAMLAIPAVRRQNSMLFVAMAACLAVSFPLALIQLRKVWRRQVFEDDKAPSENSVRPFSYAMIVVSGAPLLLTQILAQTDIDVWLSGAWLSREDTALYGLARRLMIQTIVPLQILNLMISSSVAELYGRGQTAELQRMLRSTATFSAVLSITLQGILVLFHGPILEILFGSYYVQAGTILMIMAAGEMINVASGSCGLTLALAGKSRVLLTASLICTMTMILLGTWAVKNHGIVGLAIVTASTRSLLFFLLWILARIYVGVWTHPTITPFRVFRSLS